MSELLNRTPKSQHDAAPLLVLREGRGPEGAGDIAVPRRRAARPDGCADGSEGSLAALGVIRAMAHGILAGQASAQIEESATGEDRVALDEIQAAADAGDRHTRVLPVVVGLGRLAAAALALLHAQDSPYAEQWLDVQARPAGRGDGDEGTAFGPDTVAGAVVKVLAGQLWAQAGKSSGHGDGGVQRVADLADTWLRDESPQDTYRLVISLGHFAARVLVYALQFDRIHIEAYLDGQVTQFAARGAASGVR